MILFEKKNFILPGSLIVLVVLTYVGTLGHGFIWDDNVYLTDRALRSVEGLKTIWIKPTSTDHPYYPLTHSLFWVLDQLGGQNPIVYHLVNILIHSANAVLVWLILSKLNIMAPWICAAVFAVHPVHVESVAWVAQIKNTLSAMFYLLSLYLFVCFRFDQTDKQEAPKMFQCYYLSLLMFAFSMLSKTAFCMLPFGLLIVQWYKLPHLKRNDVLLTAPYFVVAAIVGIFTIWMEYTHVGSHGDLFSTTFLERVYIAGRSVWFYAYKLLIPLKLNFVYPRWDVQGASIMQSLFPLGVIGGVGLLSMKRNQWGKGALAAVLFFIIHLFPVLGFINIYMHRYTFVTDHWQYVASLSMSTLYAVGAVLLCQKYFKDKMVNVAVGCLIAVLSFLSMSQARIYYNKFTVFDDVVKKDPQSWFGYSNRGVEYLKTDEQKAFNDFKKALEINPALPEAHNNLAKIYHKKGRSDLALKHFTQAISVSPGYYLSYIHRGAVYHDLKQYSLAMKDFQMAEQYKSDHPMIYNNRGLLFEAMGQEDSAMDDFNKAIFLDAYDFAISYYNRGRIFQKRNQLTEALKDYSRAIDIDPSYARAYNNRAVVYSLMGKNQQAVNDLKRVLIIDPGNVSAKKNMRLIQAVLNQKS